MEGEFLKFLKFLLTSKSKTLNFLLKGFDGTEQWEQVLNKYSQQKPVERNVCWVSCVSKP